MKTKLLLLVSAFFLLTGCPYTAPVQQGNVLTPTQVSQVRVGMSKAQVRRALSTPVLANAFSSNCWSYVYSKQVNGGKVGKAHLVLLFKNNRLIEIERQ